MSDQSAATIANLLVEEVVSQHGVPSEVLSDRGRAFLSGLLREVQKLLGSRKPTLPLTISKRTGWWKDLTEPSLPC